VGHSLKEGFDVHSKSSFPRIRDILFTKKLLNCSTSSEMRALQGNIVDLDFPYNSFTTLKRVFENFDVVILFSKNKRLKYLILSFTVMFKALKAILSTVDPDFLHFLSAERRSDLTHLM